jgi:iron complex transport system substrate-binding protein
VPGACVADALRSAELSYTLRLIALAAMMLPVACEQAAIPNGAGSDAELKRIVSLAPHVTELIYAVGAGARLVGVVEYSDYPPEANTIPRIGDAFRVDYERLEVLQPDIVIGWESGNPPEMIERIRELGFRVELVDAKTLDDVAGQIEKVGALTGATAQAEALAAELRLQLAGLRGNQTEGIQPGVFWQISADPYYTITGQHVLNEIIELCGGRNIFADVGGLAAPVSLEAILAREPDVIVAAVHPLSDSWQSDWQRWTELPAVARQQLYSVDSDLVSRPGPRLVEGAAEVCKILAAATAH